MYDLLHSLLADRGGAVLFSCFSIFHLFWIAATLAAAFLLRHSKRAERVLNLAVGLYTLDFFLMPLAYGYIDIEKLPFHVCTAMCLMCFFSRYSPCWRNTGSPSFCWASCRTWFICAIPPGSCGTGSAPFPTG